MRPDDLKTKIFLDGGDPTETNETLRFLGFLDGQTTNPTLIAKSPRAAERLAAGNRFNKNEVFTFYRTVVEELSGMLPKGSVSIEVYADKNTTAEEMVKQALEMNTWIPNAHIKLPITTAGLAAAEELIKQGLRLNLTLCFSQSQAAAVYAATRGGVRGQVFVSPFVGRLDDRGENGMDLIANILQMYAAGDGHVEVLTASIRNMDHFMAALQQGSDIATVPYKLLRAWSDSGCALPAADFVYTPSLKPIEFREFDLNVPWQSFDIYHTLTEQGIEKFSTDWNTLIQ